MKLAITGASGHIGHRLVQKLASEGYETHAFIRSRDRSGFLPDQTNLYIGDVRDESMMREFMQGVDAVAHLAYGSRGLGKTVDVSTIKLIHELALEHGTKSIVYMSTLNAHDDFYTSDSNVYTKAKRKAGNWLISQESDISKLILHPSYVIGPGDYKLKRIDPYITVFSNKILIPPMYTFNKTNYVHVDVVVDSIIEGLVYGLTGSELVCGSTLSLKEYFELIAKHCPESRFFLPTPGATYWLPVLLEAVSRIGLLPSLEYRKLDLFSKNSVPDGIQYTSPVKNKDMDTTVGESIDWYKNAGLL
jgi:dihydroflavonol-4-reductase